MSDEPAPPSLLYVLKQLELATRSRLEAVVRPAGITALQYTALTVLARRSMTAADLARASFVRAQSTADLVGALERRGLVARTSDPAHGRRLLIALTDAGRDLLSHYDPLVAAIEDEMVADLDAAGRAELRARLQACRAAITR